MKCSSCKSEFTPSQIKEKQQGLVSPKVKCPECGVWLSKDIKSSVFQLSGLAAALLGMLGAQGYIPFDAILGLVLLIVGFIAFLYSFRISKWRPTSENS